MSHTPGPWTDKSQDESQWGIYDAKGRSIAQAHQIRPLRDDLKQTERTANARLIAAAPDLLSALMAILAVAEGKSKSEWNVVTDCARIAIAKAKGEA